MTDKKLKQCEAILDAAHLRKTKPRLVVISALLDTDKPLTQEMITAQLSGHKPNKVTIYRMLESMVEKGIVHKAYVGKRKWHYELAHNCSEHQCHPHFTCSKCSSTSCLTGLSIPMAKSPFKGFIIDHQQVRLEGLCPECVEKSGAEDET